MDHNQSKWVQWIHLCQATINKVELILFMLTLVNKPVLVVQVKVASKVLLSTISTHIALAKFASLHLLIWVVVVSKVFILTTSLVPNQLDVKLPTFFVELHAPWITEYVVRLLFIFQHIAIALAIWVPFTDWLLPSVVGTLIAGVMVRVGPFFQYINL